MNKVWVDRPREMNKEYAFCLRLENFDNMEIQIACSNCYQIYINGKFLSYGPLRSAHGYSLISKFKIDAETDVVNICILAIDYGINSYYIVDEPPFIAVQIHSNGKEIASIKDFKAYPINERIQKVERLCLQRNFVEDYRFSNRINEILNCKYEGETYPLIAVEGNILSFSKLSNALFEKMNFKECIETGAVLKLEKGKYFQYETAPSGKISKVCKGYDYDEIEERISDEICSFDYKKGITSDILEDEYKLYDLGANKSGFIKLDFEVISQTANLYMAFDEILYEKTANKNECGDLNIDENSEKKLIFHRLSVVNAVKYNAEKGKYSFVTFEPYTFKYLKLIVKDGQVKINDISFITYENIDSYKLKLTCSDNKIQQVFNSAQNTFAQNAVDVLTDCPSRERAGWLCDSFFSGRAEKTFTGKNIVEKNFLNNYLIMPPLKELPKEIFPMCYPADHLNGTYIPNWSLWFIIELKDYLERTGDIEFVIKFKTRVIDMLEFFLNNYCNSDGLLEKLDRWVFIEWSKANTLTQDVNYPSNMLFYACLKNATEMFHIEKYDKLAENVKNKIIEQSYNGEFFEDNRVRKDGVLTRTYEKSETCQYYAFFFNVADRKEYAKLYSELMNKFGAKRDTEKVYPSVYKSNAFIGNFLRLELIKQDKNYKKLLDESLDYLYNQAMRTGTLWEHDRPEASCNHGFTSYVATMIIEALSGFSGIKNGKPTFENKGVGIDCEIVMPIDEKLYLVEIKKGIIKISNER